MVDAVDSKSTGHTSVRVRVPPGAPFFKKDLTVNYFEELQKKSTELLNNIKTNQESLDSLLDEIQNDYQYPDLVYRFYHTSFKVYRIQKVTDDIVRALELLAPEGCSFNEMFKQILKEGTSKVWTSEHNKDWMTHTRPMLEAFFHARYFLEMAVLYGRELKESPQTLPSGWAGLLYLYNLR